MSGDWQVLVWPVLGVMVLFAVVIVLGLRYSTRRQLRVARETHAPAVLAGMRLDGSNRADLLYGVWNTTMTEVILRVRDGMDTEVATIVHRAVGARISTGGGDYEVAVTSGWRESASLLRVDDPDPTRHPLCTFELRGWAGQRVARYTLPDRQVLSIRSRWSVPWRRAPLPIARNGRIIGRLSIIGDAAHDDGRAVVLPSTIPLPVRLFVVYKAAGSGQATSHMP
jgi:hypothetical protein